MKEPQTRSALGANSLSAEYFLSPEIFARETHRIFSRRWVYTGRVEDLRRPGSFLLRRIAGESVLLVGSGDIPRAFYNVCRHRGTRLCESESGRFPRSIRCPYHGWTYDLAGCLVAAPNMLGVETFDPERFSLVEVDLEEYHGMVFASLERNLVPLHSYLEPLMGRFQDWGISKLRTVRQIRYDVRANWKLIFQNYSECYHCPTLHPHLSRITPYRESSNDLQEGPILGGPMRISANAKSLTTDGKLCGLALSADDGRGSGSAYYYTVFPNLFVSLFPDYVMLHRLTPQSPRETQIECDWLFDPAVTDNPDFDPSPAVDFWDLTNRQDWHICEQVQDGVSSRAYRPGPYSNLESIVAAFDREYLLCMDGARNCPGL